MIHHCFKTHGWSYGSTFAFSVLLAAALLCFAAGQTAAQEGFVFKQPNFVVILADDLGYGDLGCYGNKTIKTPNLDKLAKQGLKLTSYYSGAPVCSPSRAALLTGRIPQRDGINDWIPLNSPVYLPRATRTIAAALGFFKYDTAMVGKWHLNGKMDGSQPTPGDHGFQYWFATQNNAEPTHENPLNFLRNGAPVGPLQGYSSTLIVNEALDWLNKRSSRQPFFLYVALHSPHERVATADEFVRQYASVRNSAEAQYYGNVTQMDFEVGRLLNALDELGLAKNTLVFFSSDNGPETLNRYSNATRSYGTPGKVNGKALRGMKLHLYEGGIRVPGIVRWPGVVSAGRVSDEPVGGVDLMPTLLASCGVQLEEEFRVDGVSVLPLLRGAPFVRERPLYWQYDNAVTAAKNDLPVPKVALRDGDWKLLVQAGFNTVELYNVKLDPQESKDRSAKQLPRVQAMLERLKLIYNQITFEVRADR